MISDYEVRKLVHHQLTILLKNYDEKALKHSQIFWGQTPHLADQHPGGCERHIWTFNKFNIIPKNCFNCYKILIEPQTVIELFKLMMVLDKLQLPNNNARKCMTETRATVSGAYKGYIYCDGIEESNEILKLISNATAVNISKDIPISLKHGCSEFSNTYPEYSQVEQDKAMKYKEEWQEQEQLADEEFFVNNSPATKQTFDRSNYNLHDAGAMLFWIRYAATIGDSSYLHITDSPMQPFEDLNRAPFHTAEDQNK